MSAQCIRYFDLFHDICCGPPLCAHGPSPRVPFGVSSLSSLQLSSPPALQQALSMSYGACESIQSLLTYLHEMVKLTMHSIVLHSLRGPCARNATRTPCALCISLRSRIEPLG